LPALVGRADREVALAPSSRPRVRRHSSRGPRSRKIESRLTARDAPGHQRVRARASGGRHRRGTVPRLRAVPRERNEPT
jgi:hypothetical protein